MEDDEAALLAELLAISSKSASSRFQDDNDTGGATPPLSVEPAAAPKKSTPPAKKASAPISRNSAELPPWKRKTKPDAQPVNDNVVVAASQELPPWKRNKPKVADEPVAAPAVQPSAPVAASETNFAKANNAPFTFNGDRGGSAEDADLLAELMAISSKSKSRFASGDDEPAAPSMEDASPPSTVKPKVEAPKKSAPSQQDDAELPPWKRKNKPAAAAPLDEDIVVAAPAAPQEKELPPWKRNKPKVAEQPVDVVVAPAPAQQMEQGAPSAAANESNFAKANNAPFTFNGDRGGSAEDADLLAELMAISSKSGSTSRFASGGDDRATSSMLDAAPPAAAEPKVEAPTKSTPGQQGVAELPPWKRKSKPPAVQANEDVLVVAVLPPPQEQDLPPWKRNKPKVTEPVDVIVAAAPPPREEEPPVGGNFTKSSEAFTFNGDRGGTAEDADLLAELKAISSQSNKSSRFSAVASESSSQNDATITSAPENMTSSEARKSALPPWKRGKKAATNSKPEVEVDARSATIADPNLSNPPPTGSLSVSQVAGGIKSDLPSTFKGDRGGAAEDADLLAELRAISSGAGGTSRFKVSESSGENAGIPPPAVTSPVAKLSRPSQSSAPPPPSPSPVSAPPPPFAQASNAEEIVITRESLEASIKDKNWKIRKQAYIFLRQLLAEEAAKGQPAGSIRSDSVVAGLDEKLITIVCDSNASALDFGLQFALDFAGHCSSASDPVVASNITTALLKGNGFSGRPTTSKLASALALKLMEVGAKGAISVHAVVGVLLEKGVTSKKPKVVIASSSVTHNAALDFGAANLPLAAIKASAPKMLKHTNAVVRESGMNIIADICRALGSKAPLQDLLGTLKQAQLSQLDSMLEAQPSAAPPRIGLRSAAASGGSAGSSEDALAVLEAQSKEMEAERFANRPRVNIFDKLASTEYSTRVHLPKWSEKVAALGILIECGGEKPFKLALPGSSINYAHLVAEMKKLLGHTHFAVASKAMQVLSMFAEGVGEKLYPNLRPLLTTLLQIGKDKKLTKAVASCLDIFFGNILSLEHLLEKDDAVPSQLNEQSQKNALARCQCLEYLGRCILRGDSAGKRGELTTQSIKALGMLAKEKLSDTDAKVRKAALEVMQTLLSLENRDFEEVVEKIVNELEVSNARAYKSLNANAKSSASSNPAIEKRVAAASTVSSPKSKAEVAPQQRTTPSNRGRAPTPKPDETATAAGVPAGVPESDGSIAYLQSLQIRNWGADEDNDGILAGLKSSKWLSRQRAIQSLNAFCREYDVLPDHQLTSSVLGCVKLYTKNFKDSNVNIMKSTFELFIGLCELHTRSVENFPLWATKGGVSVASEKLADKKLAASAASLLTKMCVVNPPSVVIDESIASLDRVKSPLVHEAYLKWLNNVLIDFGVSALALDIKQVVSFLGKESQISNVKVKKAALSVLGEFHTQLGPAFRAMTLSLLTEPSTKAQLDSTFDSCPYDSNQKNQERTRECVVLPNGGNTAGGSGSSDAALLLDVPRLDLVGEIGPDCIPKMKSKEGKTSWKLRKEAMDEVSTALDKGNGGMLSTSSTELKSILELLRALKERLSDSQSNLKPLAATLIGRILASLDKIAQGKLSKVVLPPLVTAAMNDSRKPMRDASLESIKAGTKLNELEGGESNELSLEALIVAIVGELKESEFKTAGIPDVLLYAASVAESMPNLDAILAARGEALGEKFANVMVDCLTSSKSETRAAAESLIRACSTAGTISDKTLKKGLEHLKPAQQRSVTPIIMKIVGKALAASRDEKENLPAKSSKSREGRSTKPEEHRPPRALSRGRKPARNVPPRRAIEKKASFEDQSEAETSEIASHPLAAPHGSVVHKGRRHVGNIAWVEFPEEPTGSFLMNTLRKGWSQILSKHSQAILFPSQGIQKQDDAREGCELLSRSIHYEGEHGGDHVLEQLDLILKWSAFALCSRENTVGLQALLSMLLKLVAFLGERRYMLADQEALLLFPYILEKTSIAKGRFRDLFDDLVKNTKALNAIPTKTMGATVCTTTIERSANAKARVFAYGLCAECVDLIGLAGIGKRGLLVVAKMVSDEKLSENRSAALDLMLVVLAKMDGDIDRLARLCSTSMSDKSRDLIEERWSKRGTPKTAQGSSNTGQGDDERSKRRSLLPPARKSMGDRRKALQGLAQRSATAHERQDDSSQQELPPFQLRLTGSDISDSPQANSAEILPSLGPFTFSYSSRSLNDASPQPGLNEARSSSAEVRPVFASTRSYKIDEPEEAESNSAPSPPGAAASLRARLLKIRQKHVVSDEEPVPVHAPAVAASNDRLKSSANEVSAPTFGSSQSTSGSANGYRAAMDTFEVLLSCSEITERDPAVKSSISALKQFHGAVSEKDSGSTGEQQLLEDIRNDVTNCVERLTTIVRFAFDDGDRSQSAGMCVPLLSVVLATLMALFRDADLAQGVSQDALVVLIRETGRCLLDSRLAVSATHVSGLDESTSSQMVRGMNKLAVQAATGSARHTSLQAMIVLQEQLTLQDVETPIENAFNGRLSRIVMKLFGKVIKTEEASSAPYSSPTMDLEALFCTIEDMLSAVHGKAGTGKDMALALTTSILKFRSAQEVKEIIRELGMDDSTYGLWSIVMDLAPSPAPKTTVAPYKSSVVESPTEEKPAASETPTRISTQSKDVAQLVSDIGSASTEPERLAAVEVLRRYRERHGDNDLVSHLEKVSDAFGDYIREQLRLSVASPTPKIETDEYAALPMSARIRNLRSRLAVSDLATDATSPAQSPAKVARSPVRKYAATTPTKIPTPSRIPKPGTPKVDGSSSTVLSLRQRLAAAQANRTMTTESPEKLAPPAPQQTEQSHAALLRARLRAVKTQTQKPEDDFMY